MSTEDVIQRLVAAQRRRLVATIMGAIEEDAFAVLDRAERDRLRRKVMAGVGAHSDFVLDLIRSSNEGAWVSDEAMRVLHEINSKVDVRYGEPADVD